MTPDHETLLAIRDQLDGVEWSTRTLDEIAAILIEAGYQIRDLAEAQIEADAEIMSDRKGWAKAALLEVD